MGSFLLSSEYQGTNDLADITRWCWYTYLSCCFSLVCKYHPVLARNYIALWFGCANVPGSCCSWKRPRHGWMGSEQPSQVENVLVWGRGIGTRWSLRSLPSQDILWNPITTGHQGKWSSPHCLPFHCSVQWCVGLCCAVRCLSVAQ